MLLQKIWIYAMDIVAARVTLTSKANAVPTTILNCCLGNSFPVIV